MGFMAALFYDYFVDGGKLLAWDFAYTGLLFNIVMTWLASGYLSDKLVNATYAHRSTFYNYAHNSTLGNYMGLFEVLNLFGFITVGPLLAAFGAAYSSYNLWTQYEVYHTENITLSKIDGFKYMVITVVKALAPWVSGLALGVAYDDLISFYGTYNQAVEAQHCDDDGTNCTTDSDGTSLTIDLFYHEIASWSAIAAFAFIVFGADELWLDTITKM